MDIKQRRRETPGWYHCLFILLSKKPVKFCKKYYLWGMPGESFRSRCHRWATKKGRRFAVSASFDSFLFCKPAGTNFELFSSRFKAFSQYDCLIFHVFDLIIN